MDLSLLKLMDTVETVDNRIGIVLKLESVEHINHMYTVNNMDLLHRIQYVPKLDGVKKEHIFYQTVTVYHPDNNSIVAYTEDNIKSIRNNKRDDKKSKLNFLSSLRKILRSIFNRYIV